MVKSINVDDVVKGKVTNITRFGAFVSLEGYQRDGLLHISEIDKKFVKDVGEYFSVGDEINVKIKEIKDDGKISLSRKGIKGTENLKNAKKKNNQYRYLPVDTNDVLANHPIDNYALKVNRFINQYEDQCKINSRAFLQRVAGSVISRDNNLLSQINNRFDKQLESMEAAGYFTSSFTLKNDFRIIPGLGGSNVLETNLSLHHIYGIPYLPGSSLKGLAKSWAIEKIRDCYEIEDYSTVENLLDTEVPKGYPKGLQLETIEMYRHLFGTQQEAGQAIFFDAFPVEKICTEVDVMTPHFKDYYNEMESTSPHSWPVDSMDPNIVPFLVMQGTTFTFRLAVRFTHKKMVDTSKDYLQKTVQLLKEGLQELGVGAKTMIGYGYFNGEQEI